MKTVILILLITGLTMPQSLDSIITVAMANNMWLKSLESRVKEAEYKADGVTYLPPPELGLKIDAVPFNTIDVWNSSLQQELSFSQMFMLGGKLNAMGKAEGLRSPVASMDAGTYRLKLIKEITALYYNIWMLEHHIELREERENQLALLSDLAESNYSLGDARLSEVLSLKGEAAANKTDIEILQRKVNSEIAKLNVLAGREIEAELNVRHNWDVDSLAFHYDSLKIILTDNNPELKKMELMEQMLNLDMVANNKELIPDLMVGAMIMRMPRGMILTEQTNTHGIGGGGTEYMYGLMASVTLPFLPWSSGKIKAREQELLASIDAVSAERKFMRDQMSAELLGMMNDLNSARREIKVYRNEIIPLYRDILEAQLNEYRNKLTSINSVIETLNMLLMREEMLAEMMMMHQIMLGEIKGMGVINNNFNERD